MTTIIAPAPEPKWTCDEHGNWHQEQRVRIRHGNGTREVRVIEAASIEASLIEAVREALGRGI